MPLVKCIEIDSFSKTIKHVSFDLTADLSDKLDKKYSDGLIFHRERDDDSIDKGKKNDKGETFSHKMYCIYFHKNDLGRADSFSDCGFRWVSTTEYSSEEIKKLKEDLYCRCYEGVGKAVITAYDIYDNSSDEKRSTYPVDIDLTLKEVEEGILEWTNGVVRRLPEFTCMLNKKFDDQESYELLLRMENKELLYQEYELEFVRPLKHINEQIVSFDFDYNEITVLVGRLPKDLNQKIRVAIFRTDTGELKQIDACTMAAHKASGWIKRALEDYFQNIYVGNKIVKNFDAELV